MKNSDASALVWPVYMQNLLASSWINYLHALTQGLDINVSSYMDSTRVLVLFKKVDDYPKHLYIFPVVWRTFLMPVFYSQSLMVAGK